MQSFTLESAQDSLYGRIPFTIYGSTLTEAIEANFKLITRRIGMYPCAGYRLEQVYLEPYEQGSRTAQGVVVWRPLPRAHKAEEVLPVETHRFFVLNVALTARVDFELRSN